MNDYEHDEDDDDCSRCESEASRRAAAIHLAVGMALCIGMTASTVYWVVTWYV